MDADMLMDTEMDTNRKAWSPSFSASSNAGQITYWND